MTYSPYLMKIEPIVWKIKGKRGLFDRSNCHLTDVFNGLSLIVHYFMPRVRNNQIDDFGDSVLNGLADIGRKVPKKSS